MKKLNCLLISMAFSLLLSAQEIPQKISYQGKLLEDGAPVNGTKSMIFTIGTWSETHNDVEISEGLYSVTLGDVNPILSSLFNDNSFLELEIEIEGTTLEENTSILSSPYAFKAENAVDADNLNGQNPSYYQNWNNLNNIPSDIADGDDVDDIDSDPTNEFQEISISGNFLTISSGGSGTNSIQLPNVTNLWSQYGSSIYYTFGNVGIGTSSPANDLHLLTATNGGGATLETSTANVYLSLNNTGSNGNYWRLASTSGSSSLGGSTGNFAISNNGMDAQFVVNNSGNVGIGTSSPTNDLHLLTATNGGGATLETSTANVYLSLNNTGSNGNYWRLASTSGSSSLGGPTGNFAISNNGMDAQFVINNSGNVGIGTTTPQTAVKLEVHNNTNSSCAIGAYDYASSGSAAIFGYSEGFAAIQGNGANANYAGYFTGNVSVSGSLSKGGGSFKIDHPLDPENKYLYHSFVESPDMMNVYNGNITTNESGIAVVQLPDYFEVLNKDFRYQLTCFGVFSQAIVYEKFNNNQFTIKTEIPNVEVSWQITGIRQDPYANQNRIQVEVEKSANEKGHYLHYKEYGQPIEKSIEIVKNPELLEELNK